MLKTRTATLLVLLVALAATAHHAQAQTAATAAAPAAPKAEPPGQPVNIRLDLKITEHTGAADPTTKTLAMIVADQGSGSMRSVGTFNQGQVQIRMDARPQILSNGAVRLALGLDYNPRQLGPDSQGKWITLSEQISVVLEPGVPLVISQAADPASERLVRVEVSATTGTRRP